MHGIRPKIKPVVRHAGRMVLPLSCRFRGGCTFIGRTTTRCVWIRITGPRHASLILVDHGRRMKRLRGKDNGWVSGVSTILGTAVPAREDLGRTRGEDK